MRNYSQIFTDIYKKNKWGNGSGPGSDVATTQVYRDFIEFFIRDTEIKSVADFGCGDWQFSKLIDWNEAEYVGYDCVELILNKNIKNYENNKIKFELVRNLEDFFHVKSDLLLIKDVLQHWSNEEIDYFLNNVKNNFKYIIVTNSSNQRYDNQTETIEFRPLSAKYNPLKKYGFEIKKEYVSKFSNGSIDPKEISILKNN